MRVFSLVLIAAVVVSTDASAGKRPWQRRRGRDVDVRHKLAHQHVRPEMWPSEPLSPDKIDAATFESALDTLCGRMPPERLSLYTATIIGEAKRFDIDPFLLAALMYDRSGCRPRTPDRETTWGLTRLDVEMHAPHIRGGEYRYYLREDGEWIRHALKIDIYPFNKWKAQKIESNLYFAAAIIKVFTLQCKDLDETFGGAPHRHPVSHWFYGDRVGQSEPEDRVLTIRRRLLAYYHGAVPAAAGAFGSSPLVSPLDGVPRLVIDYFGNKRGNKGSAGHQGIDIDGLTGEPVRAVSDGKVSFAGIDLPGPAKSRQTTPSEAASIPNRALGPGGLWVTINHGNGFRSCYMHLDSIAVSQGETVEAGQIIGTLGRSGTVLSGPHLHLEFRLDKGRVDPAVPLRDVLVNPFIPTDAP